MTVKYGLYSPPRRVTGLEGSRLGCLVRVRSDIQVVEADVIVGLDRRKTEQFDGGDVARMRRIEVKKKYQKNQIIGNKKKKINF